MNKCQREQKIKMKKIASISSFTFLKKKILFIFFRERVKEGEREGEKHQCVVASRAMGTWPATQACALTGN